MNRQQRRSNDNDLRKFFITSTRDKLTASTGIGLLVEMFYKTPLFTEIAKHLPERTSHRSLGSAKLALTAIAAHLIGAESVEDLEELRDDEYLIRLFGGNVPAPRTILDFLNDFKKEHIEGLNKALNIMARTLHSLLQAEHPQVISDDRIVDLDSTYHIHYGDTIEGLWWNYKNEWTLESQSAFSSLGFCHQVWLRPGNTKSGTDADVMIKNIFTDSRTQVLRKRQGHDYTRMDSAFCNQATIKGCLDVGAFFTITAHKATTYWHTEMEKQGIDWIPWEYTQKELDRFAKQDIHPPRIELGRIWWKPSWSEGKLCFPIVIKRTWKSFCKIQDKSRKAHGALFHSDSVDESGGWDYYAVVTNFDLTKWSLQKVMQLHQKRASSENMNKETKYGYKLNNFPCRSLVANQAWYMFAMIAHNILRLLSLMDDPDHPKMAKKIRRKFVNFPAKIQERSKKYWLKVPDFFYKGVIKLIEGWRFPEKVFAHMFSTA